MRRALTGAALLAVPLAVGGFVLTRAQRAPAVQPDQQQKPVVQLQAEPQGYVCPVTGDELPCPKCCPLNQE